MMDGEETTGSTRIPRPRKGILKRSGSAHGIARLSPPVRVTTGRPEHELTCAPAGASKIPKLCVTWWETNSICGEAPASSKPSKLSPPPLMEEGDGGSEENDETESVRSGSSSIGHWWFGRTTRYVPHCQRRHLHSDDTGRYITPTQRKNKEIAQLKQEMKGWQKLVEDKEKHLQQLRDKLGELERIMDQGGLMVENQRLQAKLNMAHEDGAKERRQLILQWEEKLTRLKNAYERDSVERETTLQFELDELRSSFERYQQQQQGEREGEEGREMEEEERERDSGMSSMETGTMTDETMENTDEVHQWRTECNLLRNRLSQLEFLMSQYERDSPEQHSCGNKNCDRKRRTQAAQLEAYRNECAVWRTKAAEVEITLKQQTLWGKTMEQRVQGAEQALRTNQRQQTNTRLRSSSSLSSLTNEGWTKEEETGQDNTYSRMRGKVKHLEKKLESTKKQLRATIGHLKGPCAKEQCMEERKRLAGENERLNKEVTELEESNEGLTRQLDEAKRVVTERTEMMKTSEQVIQNLESTLSSKRTELEVTQLTVQKLKEDNDKLSGEVNDANGKLSDLESIMADCGIVVSTRSAPSGLRRKGGRSGQQPAQLVFRAREVQTDLNWLEQVKMESELRELVEQHAVLRAKYDEEKGDLEMKLDEISQNLHLKNNLVGTLTSQIQMLNEEYEAARAGFERERLQYNQRLHELDLMAQKVPFLEHDVASAREEVQLVESSYEKEKGRFERAMEDSLTESMKSQRQNSQYWKAKLEETAKEAELYKRKHQQAQQELSDTIMRMNLEKMEVERKLEGACLDVSALHGRVFPQRQHRATQTVPSVQDKAVLCYVKTECKASEIGPGELIDEREQQLNLMQGELNATRRQVQVLQEKLLTTEAAVKTAEEAEEELVKVKDEMENSKADARVQRERLQTEFQDFLMEKKRAEMAEQKRVAELEAAFEQVRRDLDSIIQSYEGEKRELQLAMEGKCDELEMVLKEKEVLEHRMAAMMECWEEQAFPELTPDEGPSIEEKDADWSRRARSVPTVGGDGRAESTEPDKSEELEELKHQLQQAEHCAARLESEATLWRKEVALLKGCDRKKGPDEQTEWKALTAELAEYKRECAKLRTELGSAVSKQCLLVRRQQEEMERLRTRHENELSAVRKVLDQLKRSGQPDQEQELRKLLDGTTAALLDKSRELEKLERDVICLKARLAELSPQSADDPGASSFAAYVENLRVKHRIELEILKQELTEKTGLSGEDSETISAGRDERSDDDRRLVELGKELGMVDEELRVKSINYAMEISRLNAENEELRARLNDNSPDDSAKMEAAVAAAQDLREKVEELREEMEGRERHHQEMYLLMFRKGQQAARMEEDGEEDGDGDGDEEGEEEASCVSGWSTAAHSKEGLSKEEIVLHFLRDAVYYFMIDRDAKDHLQAIMSILKFSEHQRQDVLKAKGFV